MPRCSSTTTIGRRLRQRVDVVDTVGAGDAFAAGLAYGVLDGRSVPEILDLAIRLGRWSRRARGDPRWSLAELGALIP